jgi:hypothetical protein
MSLMSLLSDCRWLQTIAIAFGLFALFAADSLLADKNMHSMSPDRLH